MAAKKEAPNYKNREVGAVVPTRGELVDPVVFYAARKTVLSKTTQSGDTEFQVTFVTDRPEVLEIGSDPANTLYLLVISKAK